jgi:hypothetical protein
LVKYFDTLSLRPDFKNQSEELYSQALELHHYAREQMKEPKREIEEHESIERNTKLFHISIKTLNEYHRIPEIKKTRDDAASQIFFYKLLVNGLLVLLLLISINLSFSFYHL